jgi:fatty-acyl-CoA synthase
MNCWIEPPISGRVHRPRFRTLAEARVIEQTPWTDRLPAWTILDALDASAASTPTRSAITVVDPDDPTRAASRMTYRELAARVRATARRLEQVSGAARPVVSILTPLVPEAFIASWAGAAVGIANPINPFLRIDHVARIMNAAGTTVLVCGTSADGPGAWQDVSELRTRVPTLQAIWFVDAQTASDSFEHQIHAADSRPLANVRLPHETSTLLHTGGTTAAPRLVRLTQAGQLLNAWCCGGWLGSAADHTVAVGMPYFHVAGTAVATLTPLVFGQSMVFLGKQGFRNPQLLPRFWDLVDAHGVTIAGSAPTTAAALVACSRAAKLPPGFVYWSGGATVPVQVAREFRQKFDADLHEGWGMTEVQGALITNPCAIEPRLGSIGIAFPYHRARCVPLIPQDDAAREPGTAGLLAVSGPCITPGYFDGQRDQDLFLQPADGERWLNTGDLCRLDEDGYIWLRGRAKDLIVRGAHNIDPLVIEGALGSHPAVLHAAAIGAPDVEKGEMPVAYVQLRAGADVDERQLLEHCQQEISERAAIPRAVCILESMPLTAVGKIFKPALRLEAVSDCVRGVAQSLDIGDAVHADVRERGGAISVVLTAADGQSEEALSRLRRALERYTFPVEVESQTCP